MGAVVLGRGSRGRRGTTAGTEAHGAVDEAFASRRLRRWLKGMFGGEPSLTRSRPADEQDASGRRNETARRPSRHSPVSLDRRAGRGLRPRRYGAASSSNPGLPRTARTSGASKTLASPTPIRIQPTV